MRLIRSAILFCFILVSCTETSLDNNRGAEAIDEKEVSSIEDFETLTNGLTRGQCIIAKKQLAFSLDFFKAVAADDFENLILSPFSMAANLSMLSVGASGETYSELASALGYNDISQDDIGSFYNMLVSGITASTEDSVKIKTANALWIDDDYYAGVYTSYKNNLSSFFHADLNMLDLQSENAPDIINGWADRNTEGMITKVVDKVSEYNLLIANALYFEGKWRYPFERKKSFFTNLKGSANERFFFTGTHPMSRYYNLSYKKKEDPAVFSIPFGKEGTEGKYRLYIVLPPKSTSLHDFILSLTEYEWVRWLTSMTSAEVSSGKVSFLIPEFECFSGFRANDPLKTLGIKSVFQNADFSKMSSFPLSIDYINQFSRIRIDAYGGTAAAVTITGMDTSSSPQQFIANRPFIFAISEETTQTILFMGTFTK